ncbi:extracellular solute-binding protein [Roseomonas hellenica]|uniref:Extracellular solute-binding protein n=1 Tax=Plastoroseomonas hellenica TaxID=2687306 RepID=A0ABS5F4E9_9PROT|nr:extracellular solute-binding protein [Plastoroseomonas hellenica]MBR0667411.1 extracellular solute-binding protein [Plastoroseomonas hellenica]
MTISRRAVLAAPALLIPPAVMAQSRAINLAGASYDMREPILREFARRTNATPRPWVNPSTQARVDRMRTAQVDCLTLDAPFAAYARGENLLQPIDTARIPNWARLHPLLREGRASPDAPLGLGANPGRMMYLNEQRSQVSFLPAFFQMDSIGYNERRIPAENNTLSWGELFNPRWRGRVALYGIDWLGMLDAALGMQALGLLPATTDPTGLTNSEVDTVVAFLKEKKREGHFRALWRAYGELVNLMASEEVWIADAWWPVVVEVASRGVPLRYAVAKEGYRAWCNGYGISANCRDVDLAYEWLNFWMGGFPGARQSEIGYFSTADNYGEFLSPELQRSVYGGEGRDGGSLADRAARVHVWNTRPANLEYYTEKWNEFLAA